MASPAKRERASSPAKPLRAPATEEASAASEDPVVLLRRRWELASVLHFLRVYEPVIKADLGLSAEEIETALASNNRNLARIHIALLKGIPPVNKNLKDDDGWIIVTSKKLTDWWSWVAEGANPFKSNPGKEVETYKQQDPIKRLLILKALCEVRSEQNDAVWYVNDEMKKGANISNFRKDKLGSGANGTVYWYDGDSTIGHRLYTEDVTINFKQNWKGKSGRLTKPDINIHWETVATNLDEFLEISEKVSRKGRTESAIADHLKAEIIPAVEKLQKKKERDLKRQEKKDQLLAFANSFQTRSLRNRRPVSYNYSDYDRSIEEAIKAASKAKEHDSHEAGTKEKRASHLGVKGANGKSDINSECNKDGGLDDAKYLSDLSSGDEEDTDYTDHDGGSADSDGDNNASEPYRSDSEEEDVFKPRKRTRLAARLLKEKLSEEEDVFIPRKRTRLAARLLKEKPRQGLRRSQRNVKNDEEVMHPGQLTPPPMTKKTLRQRPTPVSKQRDTTFSDSEDDLRQFVADSEDESESMPIAEDKSEPMPVSKQQYFSDSEDELRLFVEDSEDESE